MAGIRRDPRLAGLSSDHHHALVLVMRAQRAVASRDADAEATWRDIVCAFPRELAPHFEIEERLLIPALRRAGEIDTADRTAREHEALRALLSDGRDVRARLRAFGELLEAHVRFEEREVFETAQRVLDPATLDAIGVAAPRSRSAPERITDS